MAATAKTLPLIATVSSLALSRADPAPDEARLVNLVPGSGLRLPCQVTKVDLWFAEARAALERAKHLCGSCPIRAKCLAGALHRGEPWGVWGGEIFERGTIVTDIRPRGRPRRAGLRCHEVPQSGHVVPSGRS